MDEETLTRVAGTARLRLEGEELSSFREEISLLLEDMADLEALEPEGEPRLNILPVEDALREDEPSQDIDPAALLAGMRSYQGYVRGPLL